MSRLAPLDPETFTPEQARVHDIIASGRRGRVRGPLTVWLNRPGLAEAAQALGAYCRYDSALPPRLSELAILVTAVAWSAEFEWWAHAPLARDGGLPEAVIEAIRTGSEPSFAQEDEEVVFRVATALIADRALTQSLFDRAASVLGTDKLVDLIGILGYYSLVSMTLRAFEVELPADVPRQFA